MKKKSQDQGNLDSINQNHKKDEIPAASNADLAYVPRACQKSKLGGKFASRTKHPTFTRHTQDFHETETRQFRIATKNRGKQQLPKKPAQKLKETGLKRRNQAEMKESNRVMELRIPYKNWNTKRREYQLARDSSAWFLRLPLAAVDLSSPPTPHEEELELLLRRRIRRSSTCSSVAAACRRTSTWRGHYGEVGGPAESERRFFFWQILGKLLETSSQMVGPTILAHAEAGLWREQTNFAVPDETQ
jgi:hypothetical protein